MHDAIGVVSDEALIDGLVELCIDAETRDRATESQLRTTPPPQSVDPDLSVRDGTADDLGESFSRGHRSTIGDLGVAPMPPASAWR
jgi:hypothetical protein